MSANSVPGMTIQWSDLEQEPYDPEEFVERLAWRSTAGMSKNTGPAASLNPFEEQSTNPFDEDNTKGAPNLPSTKAEEGNGTHLEPDYPSFLTHTHELLACCWRAEAKRI